MIKLKKIKGATLPEMLVSMLVAGVIMLSAMIFISGFENTRKRMSNIQQVKMNELRLFDELSRNMNEGEMIEVSEKTIGFKTKGRISHFKIVDPFVLKPSGNTKDSLEIKVERFNFLGNDSLLILKAELGGGRTIDITKVNSGLKYKSLDVF